MYMPQKSGSIFLFADRMTKKNMLPEKELYKTFNNEKMCFLRLIFGKYCIILISIKYSKYERRTGAFQVDGMPFFEKNTISGMNMFVLLY